MRSTGNDIVALGTIDASRTNQFRFYSKILSFTEQALYHESGLEQMPFQHYVWLLWSVKESAYKYLKRNIPGLIFSPTKIIIEQLQISLDHWDDKECQCNGNKEMLYKGEITYEKNSFYFHSKICSEWIVTVVNDNENFEDVYWGLQTIEHSDADHQSKTVRALLLNRLGTFFPGNLQIEKSIVGYPVIFDGTNDMHIPVSLAHDGRFVGYSFILTTGLAPQT